MMKFLTGTYLIRLLVIVAAGMLITACGSAEGSSTSDADQAGNLDQADAPRGVVLNDPEPAPDFELIDHNGEPFRLSDQRGNAVAMFFGYTGCPDVCPLTLSFMARATELLGDDADGVTFLLITVDPERDDAERLAQYISRIEAPLMALTGAQAELETVWEAYDIAVERHEREDGNYLIDHSAQIWLVSPNGDLTMFLPMGADGDDLAIDLRWLLDQRGS